MTFGKRSFGCWLAPVVCVVVLTRVTDAENISLAERFPDENATSILLGASQWHPFPQADRRGAWEALPRDVRDRILALAAEYADREVPNLPATLYLEYRRVGNRNRYQDVWMQRRAMLNGLALAECVEGKGRFLDPLANVA